ncbi:hypothetical protein FPZ42_15890 [Mucilaginibacter achroorhodeus]|uniref:Uncharacterized protein n=1 Tax=Mucilaginibacter achroorhodeus TaxID=2599294 RepID=A0A563TYY0_9SPHI|nr:hypothetical protein [Mucilaginibacter achroorhodeus]TWR24577.1 hypothetical protein FPZ42_15890 [Mucilaginibacter achroorhodeus]
MKQQEVFRKTGAIIKELLDQYEYLQETQDDLNDLELELFVANTHFLKDHAEILRKLNMQRSQEQKALPPAAEERKPTPQPAPAHQEPAAPLPAIPLPPAPEPVVAQAPKPEPAAQPQPEQQTTRFNLPKPDFFRPQPKVETPRPEIPATEIKRPAGEPKYFEPVVQPVKPVAERAPYIVPQPVESEVAKAESARDTPVPSINLNAGRDADTYSFQREETGTIKHTLEINEADTFSDETTEPEHQTTVAEELAATVETQPRETEQADETDQPNIVPTNPEPVIDNTPKTASEQVPETPKFEQPVAVHEPAQNEPFVGAEEPQRPLTLNERLRAQQQGNNSSVPSQQKQEAPITDLKSAISLNDKLLFVKDLFNGYSLAYSEAIEIVNRFGNFEEADRFLKTNYVTKNNWDDKKATTEKFYALLRRRYA